VKNRQTITRLRPIAIVTFVDDQNDQMFLEIILDRHAEKQGSGPQD